VRNYLKTANQQFDSKCYKRVTKEGHVDDVVSKTTFIYSVIFAMFISSDGSTKIIEISQDLTDLPLIID